MGKVRPIELSWDVGTAYDMFVSLKVLHEPETFGLRGAWAAGVRSRLPVAEREFLQEFAPTLWPFDWVYGLPAPKNGAAVLEGLAALPPAARIPALQAGELAEVPPLLELLQGVAARGSWDEGDFATLLELLVAHHGKEPGAMAEQRKFITTELNVWANLEQSGELLLSALMAYQTDFYAEEEQRIGRVLETAAQEAQAAAAALPAIDKRTLPALLEVLTQGLVLQKDLDMEQLVLAPSFWTTPLLSFARVSATKELYLFGARPAHMSLVPGDVVPDALHQALKALADPTRLRILRYLLAEPSTPAELARRLRLRAPTVIHHLDTLRLARLVQITLSHDGRRYAIREDAVARTFALLNDFLGETETETEGDPDAAE